MIARVWRTRTDGPEATDQYRQVFATEVAADLTAIDGFRGAYLLARPDGATTVLRALTLFDSIETIQAFAGTAYDRERVTPAARAALLGSDPLIRHYDVLARV